MNLNWYYVKTRFNEYHVGVLGEIIIEIQENAKWLKGKNLFYFKKYWETRYLLEEFYRIEAE